jgi:hypothetical protein
MRPIPRPAIPAPGDDPLTPDSQRAGVINLFYWANRFHDLTYDLGFTEAARNFQHNNYGRGGVEGDRISAESQDSIGSNNANFVTPPDGGRGRLQTFLWTARPPTAMARWMPKLSCTNSLTACPAACMPTPPASAAICRGLGSGLERLLCRRHLVLSH